MLVVWIALTFFNQFIIFSLFNNFIFTRSISFLKSTVVVSNSPISDLSTLLFKRFKSLGTFSNLSISNLSTSYLKYGSEWSRMSWGFETTPSHLNGFKQLMSHCILFCSNSSLSDFWCQPCYWTKNRGLTGPLLAP